jgi:membrane protein implicated in regulation of membrane protease activity
MQQPTPLRRGLLALGVLLVVIGGTVFVLMLVLGLETFLTQLHEAPGVVGILWATVALVLELVVPALLVWIGIRCIGQPDRAKRPS